MSDDVLTGDKPPLSSNREQDKGLRLSYHCCRHEEIVIGEEEVQDARLVWRNALVGYVHGLKLPYSAMVRFVTMLWKILLNL